MSSVTLKNLIPDPTMATGWSASPTTQYSYQGGQSIKLTGTTGSPEVTVNTSAGIPLIPNHIYYSRVYGFQTVKTSGSVGFYWPIAEPNFQEGIPIQESGKWNIYSGRNNRSSFTKGSYQLRLDYNNSFTAGTMYFDAPMLIDLTDGFGNSKEPSKEWCDNRIPFFIGTKEIDTNVKLPVCVDGSWKSNTDVFVKVNGTWGKAQTIYAKINGIWKELLY